MRKLIEMVASGGTEENLIDDDMTRLPVAIYGSSQIRIYGSINMARKRFSGTWKEVYDAIKAVANSKNFIDYPEGQAFLAYPETP
jgi:hypothetical protein